MGILSDIGTTILSFLTTLAQYTVDPALRQVGYVFYYRNNLKELETQVKDLGYARDSMKHAVEPEERSGKKKGGVQNWFTKVEQLTKEADDLKAKHLAQTKCLFCPNLKLRHHLGRKSKKLVDEVTRLCDEKKNIDIIAYVPPQEEVCAIAFQDYEAFDSRTSVAKDVINELRNSNTYMTGVYGIGGVGKTTIVKEVYNQLAASGEKLFDEVVMVLDLKQNPSIERIQKAIAENLGLELPESGTPDGRARLINNRIKEKKTLVILDDVWESIDLEAVGLPRMATLKILLTSRSKLVLAKDMGTQEDFHLDVLNEEETWSLFKKMAGDIVGNKQDIRTIATQVAEKCGGLPLLIVTVARSLKDSPLYDWKDTLRRLKKLDGKGLTDKTYSAIEWSYDKLDNELESVFLLYASVVGSANSVSILDLLKHCMGLGFVKDLDTMEEARDALNSLLKKLQHSCLLLDTDGNKWVRIHDLVKHVAKHIAARDHHVLSVSHGSELQEWPRKEFCEKCTRISLNNCQIPELPEVLQCPELTMLVLESVDVDAREIPGSFFKETKKLKVLDLTKRSITLLPPSLKCLQELQTLCLDQCTILGDLALVGELQNLKILSFLDSKFKQLPEEIGQLTRLQLLDLTGCSQLQMISPDVISKLKQLEELRMGENSFNKWEAGRVGDAKRSNASLEELRDLPRLTAIQIHVPDASILPTNLFTTSKLERFQICIGSVWKWDDVDEALNALKLKLTTNNELEHGLKMLLEKTQDLYVEGTKGVDIKIFRELATGGYQQLKHLHVQTEAIFAYTINEKSNAYQVGFPNLTWLAVSELNNLRFLLSSIMARSLSQLKRLQISGCQIMEEVISIEESNKEIADNLFPQLQDLELKGLPNLTKLCTTSYVELRNPSCESLQLEDSTENGGICEGIVSKGDLDIVIHYFLFDNKVEFPNMKKLSIDGLAKLTTIWNESIQDTSAPTQPKSFDCENLEHVEIDSCESLKNIFPLSVARNLRQLQTLVVKNCGGVKEIVARGEGLQTTIFNFVFPKVTRVYFEKLSQLVTFYPGMHVCSWPLLTHLGVYECDKVDIAFAEKHSSSHEKLEAESSTTLVDRQSLLSIGKDSFPNLEWLGVKAMEFSNGPLPAAAQLFGKLKFLDVWCPESKSLVFLDKLLDTASPSHLLQLPHLKELRLVGMIKLMHLGQDDEDDNSQAVTRIPNIPNLQILFVNGFDSLRNLRSSAISFNNLTTLEVSVCDRFKYLITYSMANSLMQLTTLEVKDCLRLVQIVGSNDDEESRKEITFPRLKHLKLSGLPRLQRFCSGNCIAKFPSLETSTMSNRLKLKIFAADNQTLQLITNQGEDTDVDAWERWLAAEDERNPASTDLVS